MTQAERLAEFNCPYCCGQELIVSNLWSSDTTEPLWVVLYAPKSPTDKSVQFVEWSAEADDFVPIVRDAPKIVRLSNAMCRSCSTGIDLPDAIGRSIARLWPLLEGKAK